MMGEKVWLKVACYFKSSDDCRILLPVSFRYTPYTYFIPSRYQYPHENYLLQDC